jgi:hypothetical protein
MLRAAARALRGGRRRVAGTASGAPARHAADGRRGWLQGLARQALYSEPALRLLGHMLLVVARRA